MIVSFWQLKKESFHFFVVSCSLSSLEQRCISSHSTPVGQSCSERYHLQDSWLQNLSNCLKVDWLIVFLILGCEQKEGTPMFGLRKTQLFGLTVMT